MPTHSELICFFLAALAALVLLLVQAARYDRERRARFGRRVRYVDLGRFKVDDLRKPDESGAEVWVSSRTGLPVARPRSRLLRAVGRVAGFVFATGGHLL